MRPRNLWFITIVLLCHLQLQGQALTNAALPADQDGVRTGAPQSPAADHSIASGPGAGLSSALPDDPGQEILPVAQPEAAPATGVPVQWEAQSQTRVGDTWTLTGGVVVHYRNYVLHADKVVYHQSTTELEAEGNLELAGGPNDVLIHASRGEMRLNAHTARYFDVHGSQGVRTFGRTTVYSTTNPFLFTGRILIESSEGHYRIVDGSMTNCLLPRPDWQIISRSIKLSDGEASTSNAFFKILGVPVFYLPYLRHPVDETGRQSGFLLPVVSTGSSIRGYTFGEQYYWAINRSMDMIAGMDYYSKRGWVPNGDFRYRGRGLDHLAVRWNALLDRGFTQAPTIPPAANCLRTQAGDSLALQTVNQGGADINALGRKDFSPETHLAGDVEYLSCYVYRLVFNDNYSQAVNSEVKSEVAITHAHKGFVSSASLGRFETFASAADGNETKILHLPNLRFDVLDRPLGRSPLTWGMGSSLGYLGRAEPGFHARNVGRFDFYPHLTLPLVADGWSVVPEAALRMTSYSISQDPNLGGANGGIPTISHEPLGRTDFEASVDLRAPALERDFRLPGWNRELRHVIEPEITYRYVTGIGASARNALLFDTTDIATDTNEVGYSLTQRFYLRPLRPGPCAAEDGQAGAKECPAQAPREWASWQIAQKLYIDPNFGGALIANRRNVFDSTLDLTGAAFLASPRNLSPITSRLRFEAIGNLRIQWDMDYDPKSGRLDADNLFAGYSWGRTTVGLSHAMLNALSDNGSTVSITKNQQVQPFLTIGKASGSGFNLAANGGYDFTHGALQYAMVQAVYNWNCCGLSVGYRRFDLGSARNETQYLYSFTLANFGAVGDIRRANSAFPDPTLPPVY